MRAKSNSDTTSSPPHVSAASLVSLSFSMASTVGANILVLLLLFLLFVVFVFVREPEPEVAVALPVSLLRRDRFFGGIVAECSETDRQTD